MTTSTFLPSFDHLVSMAEEHLDPLLKSFWKNFPCPPPWKPSLLDKVNWTGCVGESVGQQLKMFMVDKCKADFDGDGVFDGGDDVGEEMDSDPCDFSCKVMVVTACLLVSVCFTAVLIYFCCRHTKLKSRTTDRESQESVQSEQTDVRPYSSCHYASAPVIDTIERDSSAMRLDDLVISQPVRELQPSFFPSSSLWQQPRCRNLDLANRELPAIPNISDDSSHYYTESAHPYEYIDDSDSVGERRFNNSRDGHHFCTCDYAGYGSSESNNSDPDALRIPLRRAQRGCVLNEPVPQRNYIVQPNMLDLNSIIPLERERTSRHIFHEEDKDETCLQAGDRRCMSFLPPSDLPRQGRTERFSYNYDDEFRDLDFSTPHEQDTVKENDIKTPKMQSILDEFLSLDHEQQFDSTHRRSVNLLPAQYL